MHGNSGSSASLSCLPLSFVGFKVRHCYLADSIYNTCNDFVITMATARGHPVLARSLSGSTYSRHCVHWKTQSHTHTYPRDMWGHNLPNCASTTYTKEQPIYKVISFIRVPLPLPAPKFTTPTRPARTNNCSHIVALSVANSSQLISLRVHCDILSHMGIGVSDNPIIVTKCCLITKMPQNASGRTKRAILTVTYHQVCLRTFPVRFSQ